MAMPRKVPVDFGVVFPYGAFAVGEVTAVRDYDKSTRDNVVQQLDADSGLPLWSVEIVDADPDATKATRTMSVKIPSKVQPVLPEQANGVPFRPIELERLTATAYIEEKGDFSRIAWSFRASDLRAPGKGAKPPASSGSDKAVA